jgi:uncharacterized protein YjbJ (UPF0337 family)
MEAWQEKLAGNWNILKGKIQQQYGDLTNDDLTFEKGKEDELIGRIQKASGKTKDQVIDWINKL